MKLKRWLGLVETDFSKRTQIGNRSSFIGLLANILLAIIKLLVAISSGASSLLADALNNLSDSLSMIVLWMGNRASSIAPDQDHPEGHGRAEYISTLAIGLIIFGIGAQMVVQSVLTFQQTSTITFQWLTVFAIVFAILVKTLLYLYNRQLSHLLNSLPHSATAQDSINDVLVSLGVLFGLIIQPYTSLPIDKSMAILIAIFIIFSAYRIINKAVAMILGKAIDKEMVLAIENHIMQFNNVLGIHDFKSHDYGPSQRMATIHVEFPLNLSLREAHRIIDRIEASVEREFNLNLLIHLDPMSENQQLWEQLYRDIEPLCKRINSESTIHRFRVVDSSEIMDVVFDWDLHETSLGLQTKQLHMLRKELATIFPTYHASVRLISSSHQTK